MKRLVDYIYENMLAEKFRNFVGYNVAVVSDKKKYADQVWDMLQSSYRDIGGIKGNGFRSKDDMINNIPMWKLYFSGGVLRYVIMYKDKQGRKSVAMGTDGTNEAKEAYKKEIISELNRTWSERSKAALITTYRAVGDDFTKYAIPVDDVKNLLPEDDIIPYIGNEHIVSDSDKATLDKIPKQLHKYFYLRDIAGHLHLKMAVGTANKTILL
jgi:hypothetical protein